MFGTKTTFRIASAIIIEQSGTKLKGSAGTGFKAPTLYQLYSDYGDENLKPEDSIGWDIGLEQSVFEKKLIVGATYFYNEFENMIDFDSATWTYVNVAEAETKGVEIFGTAQPAEHLDVRVSYTYTDTEDRATGNRLIRRPKNKFGIDFDYRFLEAANLNMGIVYVGMRDDDDFAAYPATRINLDGYILANLAGAYRITKHIELFGRAENLFDQDYEEVTGYGTPGISGFGGIKFLF
jgi:vitamin B12 transporter